MAAKCVDRDEHGETLVIGVQIWETGDLVVGNALTQLWGHFNGRAADRSPET